MGELAFAQSERTVDPFGPYNFKLYYMVLEPLQKVHILRKNFTVMNQKAFFNILHNSQVYSKLFPGLAKQTLREESYIQKSESI